MVRALATQVVEGTFEAHITVEANTPQSHEQFRQVCEQLAVKPVLIELSDGELPSQPMTGSYHRGTTQDVSREVAAIAKSLRNVGFPITRVKLEAVATNDGIPESDTEARAFPPGCYFEFHIKLSLTPNTNYSTLGEVCNRFEARLSRNAFKQFAEGHAERFVTLRTYGVGRQSAFARLEELESALLSAGFVVVNRQREYSLFDSHVELDTGWLEPPSAVPM